MLWAPNVRIHTHPASCPLCPNREMPGNRPEQRQRDEFLNAILHAGHQLQPHEPHGYRAQLEEGRQGLDPRHLARDQVGSPPPQ